MLNLLQYLPEFMPVSRSGIEAQVYAPIVLDSAALEDKTVFTPASDGDRAWEALIEFTTEQAALTLLSKRGIPPPDDVGCDVDDEEGVVLASLEWCWTEQRIGLLLSGDDQEVKTLDNAQWRIITNVDSASLDTLTAWLTGATAE